MADDSDSSSLSEHSDKEIQKLAPIFLKAKKATKLVAPPPVVSPPRPKREPSPPHELVLADDGSIAFIVMFRSRFNEIMPAKLPNFGPQDVENGVVDPNPTTEMQQLLCALLGLVLNRKKPPERGHHGRALEEAILSHKAQWPFRWAGTNPVHGGKTFENMTPKERLDLLQTLVMWSLSSSEAVQTMLKEKYKQQRHNDDENQPLSVQPWGVDGDKRRYFLVQGLDDTSFRVYREGSRHTRNAHWYNQAGTIDEVRALAKKLEEVDGTQAARRLAGKMLAAVPTFEATEEKRRRREYRREQRARFTRPEPGFSLYEGRTRGKRMRYTYDDDDDSFLSDATSSRRSARQSARATPFESGPTITSSGRQVRQPRTGDYGESLLSAPPMNTDDFTSGYSDPEQMISKARSSRSGRSGTEDSEEPVRGHGRPTRSGVNGVSNPRKRRYDHIDGLSDEDDATASEDEWNSDKNDDGDEEMRDVGDDGDDGVSEADDEESEDEDEEEKSLVVRLKVEPMRLDGVTRKKPLSSNASPSAEDDIHAEAGAPTFEEHTDESNPVVVVNGYADASAGHQQQAPPQPTSSPTAPSSYPTPTSMANPQQSYVPAIHEDKHAAVVLPMAANGSVSHASFVPDAVKVEDRMV